MFMLMQGLDCCLNVELQHWEFHSLDPKGWIMMKSWRKRLCCSCACCSCTHQLILRVLNMGMLRCCACPWQLYDRWSVTWQVLDTLSNFFWSKLLNAWNVESCLHQIVMGAGEFKNAYLEMQPYSLSTWYPQKHSRHSGNSGFFLCIFLSHADLFLQTSHAWCFLFCYSENYP